MTVLMEDLATGRRASVDVPPDGVMSVAELARAAGPGFEAGGSRQYRLGNRPVDGATPVRGKPGATESLYIVPDAEAGSR